MTVPAAGAGAADDPLGNGQHAGKAARRALAPRKSPLRRLTAGREALHAQEVQAEMSEVSGVGGAVAAQIADCPDRQVVDVVGTLRTVTLRPRGTSLTMEADLWDGTGTITLVWLGRRHIPGIQPGRRLVVHGRVAEIKGERTIFNPVYELRSSGGE